MDLAAWEEGSMPRRIDIPMRFWRRRRARRLDSLATLLIELEQLASDRGGRRSRATLRF
jgi:hypothetical protein